VRGRTDRRLPASPGASAGVHHRAQRRRLQPPGRPAAVRHDKGAEVHHVDRGGDITFHGPGQLVGYPIIPRRPETDRPLRPQARRGDDPHLADFGVEGWREEGLTGVWTERGKVAAIGVRVSRRVSMHGFALNLHPDMSYFGMMNPCGITDREVTDLSELAGRKVTLEEASKPSSPTSPRSSGTRESARDQEGGVRPRPGQGVEPDLRGRPSPRQWAPSRREPAGAEPVLINGRLPGEPAPSRVDEGDGPHGRTTWS
jgi:lipoate-protein ligase B